MLTVTSGTVTVKVGVLTGIVLLADINAWPSAKLAAALQSSNPAPARPSVRSNQTFPERLLGRRAPELNDLFAPVGAPEGMYEVYESAAPIDRIAKGLRALDVDPRPGAWELQRLGAGDAFGAEGSYNRVQMALLVGGRRLTVARGSLRAADGALTAFTLISPYPDPAMRALRSGTMTIVTRLAR
jgi:hypothetical protein